MRSVQARRQHKALVAVHQAAIIDFIASFAGQALRVELMLTPKPGLVDQHNSGAHHDMDLQILLTSARAIAPWWRRFVQIGYTWASTPAADFLSIVRPAGVLCEQSMFAATRGINTHKGTIFSLGLLCCAAGRLLGKGIGLNAERLCSEVACICVGLVDRELKVAYPSKTGGERSFASYGITGARGEAASGFALVRQVALPVYDHLRSEDAGEEAALLEVLLHLLAINEDTNLISRGGLTGLNYVHKYARKLINEGGMRAPDALAKVKSFDDELIARHLSPGGSADLLGVTWFLAQFAPGLRSSTSGSNKPSASSSILLTPVSLC